METKKKTGGVPPEALAKVYAFRPKPEPPPADLPSGPPLRIHALGMRDALGRRFWCRAKLIHVPLGRCLDDFVTHTAFQTERSHCTLCKQGATNRRRFAES